MKRFIDRLWYLVYLAILVSIGLTAKYNYLLFHGLIEMTSVVVMFCVFILAWYTRKFSQNSYLIFLGICFLFVGILDILHLLAFDGMGVFADYGANLPTQLWIVSRYLKALSFLALAIILKELQKVPRKRWIPWVFFVYLVVNIILIYLVFMGKFPVSYVAGQGLTSFKIVSEYIISLVFGLAILLLAKKRKYFDKMAFRNLMAGLVLAVLTEICFTFYFRVDDVFNMLGHYLRVGSNFFIFLTLVKSSLERPYQMLFADLASSQRRESELNKSLEIINKILRHDISNNLAVMGLSLDLYLKKKKEDKLTTIRRELDKSQELIEKMRQLDRAVSNGDKLKPYSVAKVAAKVAKDYRRLIIDIEGDAKVLADEAIYSVFDNLVSNAQIHGQCKRVRINMRVLENEVEIKVADDGKGIPVKAKRQLFREGFSFGKSGNTGLGLYIVKRTIERYDGSISVTDNYPKGTIFILYLPRL